jgi:DNA mismatch repair protein MutS
MDGADADTDGDDGDRTDAADGDDSGIDATDGGGSRTDTADGDGTATTTDGASAGSGGADDPDPTGPPRTMLDRADELTPMLSQYLELCRDHPDAVVLFQVGDFYEAFCEAAETVARVCEVTLTQREDSTGTYPMAGIPIDNAASYLEALLDADFRVAIADQVEEAEAATGLVDRAVTNVVSPGTVIDDDLLDRASATYLAAVVDPGAGSDARDDGSSGGGADAAAGGGSTGRGADPPAALATLDVSTGECRVTGGAAERIRAELERLAPAEVVVDPDTDIDPSSLGFEAMVTERDPATFGLAAAEATLSGYVSEPAAVLDGAAERRAAGALLSYAEYTQGDDGALPYVSRIQRYDLRRSLRLDATAMRSLELFESRQPGGGGTLLGTVDRTVSALGRRRLESWLRRPLVDADRIERRHDAVAALLADPIARETVRDHLSNVYDLERLAARVSQERADARDLRSLATTLAVVPELKAALDGVDAPALSALRDSLDELADVRDLIERAVVADPPQEITEGGVISDGFDDELDDLRAAEREGREWVSSLEARERERTGIDSLEVGYTQVHGYYIEVTDPNLDRVPDDYTRRQTLKNAERYYTPELKRREDEILSAAERADALEYETFREVRSRVAAETERLQSLADAVARLDVLAALATVAADAGYVRPSMGADTLRIDAGRHPVVEQVQAEFVPNGIDFTAGHVAVITGPNMSGKSTYMRQIALVCLLAQAGSFVPADAAELPILDRIFTRVGASDDIAGGQSTFMREMSELTDILHDATAESLVLLDEVGRGTSTADGLAIARAATEFIHDEVGAITLFATHYHDLTGLAADLPNAFNRHFTVNRAGADGDGADAAPSGPPEPARVDGPEADVTFLHRVADGPASSSYGVEVAKLAGVPDRVVERAREHLRAADGDPATASPSGSETTDAAPRPAASRSAADSDRSAERGDTLAPYVEGLENGDADDVTGPDAPTDAERAVLDALDDVDIARTTPLEALNTLEDLQRQLDE